jgi:tRNA A37 threonylcarbamoyladenosine biosynthesis protein TsaE
MFVALVGPKGSGKSHIVRTLVKHPGVCFCRFESPSMNYYAEWQSSGRQPLIFFNQIQLHFNVTVRISAPNLPPS